MRLCNECGVELEDRMSICPLCGTPVGGSAPRLPGRPKAKMDARSKHFLRQILWQVVSILLLSAIVATITINLSVHGMITWSVYPVTVCLIILSYAAVMALWHARLAIQLIAGWLLSTALIWIIQQFIEADWPVRLAFPLLCAVNVIGLLLYFIIGGLKVKGLNILALFFVGVTCLCLIIEGIITRHLDGVIKLQWSVIVAACLFPVIAAIIFMHLRKKTNAEIQKIFHT